jgi:hypothetical protein
MGVMGLIIFGVLRSGTILSSQNTGINVSSSRARMALDQIGEKTRYSLVTPALINTSGAAVSGTTADGIMLKKLIGSTYVVRKSAGSDDTITSATKQFVLEYQAELTDPNPGDWMLVESIERPELQISAVNSITSYTSAGSPMKRASVTTTAALGEDARPSLYRVSATLYRKMAYTFVPATGDYFELRYYSNVGPSTNFSTASNYRVEADSYRRLGGSAFFTDSISNGAETINLKAMVNASDRTEYIARKNPNNTFIAVPIQAKLWTLNH